MSRFPVAATLAALVLSLAAGAARAEDKTSAGKVKATAKATKPDADGNQTVTITLAVEDSWHLYANPVGNDMLKSAQTAVTFTTKLEGKPEITYPAGKVHPDKDVGDYKIYEGKVVIKAKVRRKKGDTAPLALTVKLQTCTDKTCLLPAKIKLTAE